MICMKLSVFKASWLTASHLPSDLESRWPGGQNVILYKKVRLEEFAPYLRPDGLVKRLTTYQDVDCERHLEESGSHTVVATISLWTLTLCVCVR